MSASRQILVDVDLGEFSTRELVAELKCRRKEDPRDDGLGDDQREIDRLADLIAEGQIELALDQLRRLAPNVLLRRTLVGLAAMRKSHKGGASR